MSNSREEIYLPAINDEYSLVVPHCPVVLVLDMSHSMWGQGLVDLKNSLAAFYQGACKELFKEAQIDIEAIRMGESYGVMEDFTPIAASTLLNRPFRPKGDTPLGASLQLAIAELDRKVNEYKQNGIQCVTPQFIVLSDGKSSDTITSVATEISLRVNSSRLVCRAIALGCNPDLNVLAQLAGKNVITPKFGNLPETFRNIGTIVSQEYTESTADLLDKEIEKASQQAPLNDADTLYLLDGTNMLYWGHSRSEVTLQHVLDITSYLKRHGMQYVVYFDATTPYILKKAPAGEAGRYEDLLKNEPMFFQQVPAGTRADDMLLMVADSNMNTIILSQDLYRDYIALYPWLSDRKRVFPGMVLMDKIYFPRINLIIPRSPVKKPSYSPLVIGF